MQSKELKEASQRAGRGHRQLELLRHDEHGRPDYMQSAGFLALKDEVCPLHMYFATYNRITSDKDIVIYPFNGHEGGGAVQTEVKLS
jgi:hypothetical protein